MKIERSEKNAFVTAFFGGIIAHLYIYTNTIPNFDGISRMYDEQQMTVSGRWFLHYVSYLHGFTQMPMVIGVIAMCFLAMTAFLVVRLLQIKSPVLGVLWGLLSVTAPSVAYINTYTFTASAYCFAIFLAAAGVWVTAKWKWGFLGASVLLACSMGTYQVFVTVAITLSVFMVLKESLSAESKLKRVVSQGIRYVVFLAAGTLLYYLILKIFLRVKNLKLLSYLGMNQIEQGYPMEQIGEILTKTYAQVGQFFFGINVDKGPAAAAAIVLAVFLAGAALVMLCQRIFSEKLWKQKVKTAGSMILILLLPIAVNFGQIMSPFSVPGLSMKYAYIYLCLLPILLADKGKKGIQESGVQESGVQEGNVQGRKSKCKDLCGIVLAGSLALMTFLYWQWDNVLYTMLNQAHRATMSFVTNVVGRIEGCEGYQTGMPVVIVGGFPADRYDADIESYALAETGATLTSSVIPLNKHIYYYMQDWLNIPIEEPEEEVFLAVAGSDEFQEMPLYPNDGSVRIIDGRVVVKMQEQFTPKAQYEKDYEERK